VEAVPWWRKDKLSTRQCQCAINNDARVDFSLDFKLENRHRVPPALTTARCFISVLPSAMQLQRSHRTFVRVNLGSLKPMTGKLVRVSYRLAARYFSCEFLASNRACSISCKFLVRVFGASFSYTFLVRLSWALHQAICCCHMSYLAPLTMTLSDFQDHLFFVFSAERGNYIAMSSYCHDMLSVCRLWRECIVTKQLQMRSRSSYCRAAKVFNC